MSTNYLMVQGTSSSAGKSLMVTALCHIFARRGISVAPFKAQNMSNNAAVCPDGSEIGRAQAVQAIAAGLDPSVDMNPILIKPEADSRSQVIVNGRAWRSMEARDYYPKKDFLWGAVTAALDRLSEKYDLVIMEGAGSPTELNLKASDMVNMAVALYAQAPVLLVGDIDRGGIFAQLLGTYWLLPEKEQKLVRGFLVNKFRGDLSLFQDGVHILEERSHVPVLGVIPYIHNLQIPEEDAVALENLSFETQISTPGTEIVVVHFPRIANFDDFDPLDAEPGVNVRYVSSPAEIENPSAIILPGTKSTIDDLMWLYDRGFVQVIRSYAENGGVVVGICGGYQMLGESIQDTHGVESQQKHISGLGLLPIETHFAPEKATYQARAQIKTGPGWLSDLKGQSISGYEIHMGRTPGEKPWLEITSRNGEPCNVMDGSTNQEGNVWGCYIHGLFDNKNLRRAWLSYLGWQLGSPKPRGDFPGSLTLLADTIEEGVDMEQLEAIIWES
jgi:adenosylcobyric acid synthase